MATIIPEVAGVRETSGTLRSDLRGVRIIWEREMIALSAIARGWRPRLVQPVLFLFVLGAGLSPLVQTRPGESFDFRTFMFPGIIAMTVLFTSVLSGISIVWDREFGFLREILVAPVHRGAIVAGKCLGGATVATVQGTLILALAGLVHVSYSPVLMLTLIAEMALTAVTLSAFGILIASRMEQVQSFGVVVQFLVMPMFFLSSAIFPLNRLPVWLATLTKLDPLSYAVDPMRRAVFAHAALPPGLAQSLNPGMSWAGWRLPEPFELGIVALTGAVLLALAVNQFSRND